MPENRGFMGDKTEITRESKGEVSLSQILNPLRFARMLDSMIYH